MAQCCSRCHELRLSFCWKGNHRATGETGWRGTTATPPLQNRGRRLSSAASRRRLEPSEKGLSRWMACGGLPKRCWNYIWNLHLSPGQERIQTRLDEMTFMSTGSDSGVGQNVGFRCCRESCGAALSSLSSCWFTNIRMATGDKDPGASPSGLREPTDVLANGRLVAQVGIWRVASPDLQPGRRSKWLLAGVSACLRVCSSSAAASSPQL